MYCNIRKRLRKLSLNTYLDIYLIILIVYWNNADMLYYFYKNFTCRFLRMSPERFENLLNLIGPLIEKQHYRFRKPISAAERLTITLRSLASGDSQQSLAFNFRVGSTTVCNIIRETYKWIWCALNKTYLKPPTTENDWKQIGHDFFDA